MGLFNFFKKTSKPDFYELLKKQAEINYKSYCKLASFFKEGNGEAEKIYFLEREGDDIQKVLLHNLNKTLITPFDREDIQALSRSIDDILNSSKSTVEEIKVFKIKPDENLVILSNVLRKGSLELFDSLKHLKDNYVLAREHAIKAKRCESHIHHVYLESLGKLYDDPENSAGFMLKMREIYRHLNRSADRLAYAADVILDVIVKLE